LNTSTSIVHIKVQLPFLTFKQPLLLMLLLSLSLFLFAGSGSRSRSASDCARVPHLTNIGAIVIV
jgi:hypothetical protein